MEPVLNDLVTEITLQVAAGMILPMAMIPDMLKQQPLDASCIEIEELD